MLLNLLSNAIKFTESGWIAITASMDHEFIKIAVKDTGSGISLENQQKLFKLFGFIQETSAQNVNGIGLGLMISRQIVEQFEGKIWV